MRSVRVSRVGLTREREGSGRAGGREGGRKRVRGAEGKEEKSEG